MTCNVCDRRHPPRSRAARRCRELNAAADRAMVEALAGAAAELELARAR